jgi:hypothetical protein
MLVGCLVDVSQTAGSVGLEPRTKMFVEISRVGDSPPGVGKVGSAPSSSSCLIFSPYSTPTQMERRNVGVFRWVGAEKVLVRGKREKARLH